MTQDHHACEAVWPILHDGGGGVGAHSGSGRVGDDGPGGSEGREVVGMMTGEAMVGMMEWITVMMAVEVM